MLDKKEIENIVNSHFEGTDKFLVEVLVSKTNIINVFVDGDEGIKIKECARLSRLIESNFDREEEDFELRVSSPGLDRPFKLIRQYKKYLNRRIIIITEEEKKRSGLLKSISDSGIELERKVGKKGKELKLEKLDFSDIQEAKPEISFNK